MGSPKTLFHLMIRHSNIALDNIKTSVNQAMGQLFGKHVLILDFYDFLVNNIRNTKHIKKKFVICRALKTVVPIKFVYIWGQKFLVKTIEFSSSKFNFTSEWQRDSRLVLVSNNRWHPSLQIQQMISFNSAWVAWLVICRP